VSLSGAGFGVHWTTILASTIGLSASNFLVGASIGLKPVDLQIMLTVANLIGIPLGIFRSWYYDNHHLKGGKFLPFIKMTALPIVLISTIFVWLPYENMEYITKAVVVWFMYMLLNIFLCFYSESYTYFQQIITPNAQERANVMSISQVIYSFAPTVTGLVIPLVAGLTWGLNNIWTYRIIYPIFTVIGLVMSLIFFRKVKERLILPKKKPEPDRMLDAIREIAKKVRIFEINTGCVSRGYRETPYLAPFIVRELKRLDCQITISSDCHNKDFFDCEWDAAKTRLLDCGYKNIVILTKDGFKEEAII
jgi:Na+/melibiose symporter-like transporter